MKSMVIGLFLAGAALLAACGAEANTGGDNGSTGTPPPGVQTPMPGTAEPGAHDDAQAALDEARARWAANGGDDYDMRFNWLCFCVDTYVAEVDLEVRDGAVVSGSYVEDGSELGSGALAEYVSVEGLFALLQDAIDRNAASIDVQYDADLGYPTEANIDYDTGIADEERAFFVHELELQ